MAEPVLCPACACACDDLAPAALAAACPRAARWLAAAPADRGLALLSGRPAEPAAARAAAADLLAGAAAPLVFGMAGVSLEAQRAALALADALHAAVLPAPSPWSAARRAMQDVGLVTASWGEVRHRAELVVLWNVEPAAELPRWRERFLDAPGELLERPRDIVRVGPVGLPLPADGSLPALLALRAAVLGRGAPAQPWRDLGARLRAARSAAIVFGTSLAAEGRWACKALFELVRDANLEGRCVAVPLAGDGNSGGLDSALAWTTGWGDAVDFGAGAPVPALPPLAADLVLAVGPEEFPAALAGIPAVRIAPTLDAAAAVSLRVREPGRSGGGTWFRGDEVPLPLRPFEPDPAPEAADLLGLLGKLRAS